MLPIVRSLSSFTALAALVMPKCPLCAVAVFSALGLELPMVAPVTIGLLVVPVVALALRNASVSVPLIAAAGAAVAIAGRFLIDQPLLFHAGVLAIFAVAVVNIIALRRQCHRCEPSSS
jgi:hypothetical protein